MWKLESQSEKERTYKNTITGSEVRTILLHRDMYGQPWWTFADLFTIPLVREIAAKKVTELAGAGMTMQDMKEFIVESKAILKSTEADKYERAYGRLLQFEKAVETVADPVRQLLGLATVYILGDQERPDSYDQHIAHQKMEAWSTDERTMGFFLNWLTDTIGNYVSAFKNIGQIASVLHQLEPRDRTE